MKRLIIGVIAAVVVAVGMAAPALTNPYYAKSEIAGVDMTLGAKLVAQSPGMEVWETDDTQQQMLNHFYKTGTTLPFCNGKFTSTGGHAAYGLYYGTAKDGIQVIVNDYKVWIGRGPDSQTKCS